MLPTTVALILLLFPLAYGPGPGNTFLATDGAQFGFWATLPSNFSCHVATLIVTAAIGFGFFAAMEGFPRLFAALKVAGAFYVLWLAWKMIRAGTINDVEKAKPATFIDGAALLVLNPKAYVIIALMFAQFLEGSSMGTFVSVMLITTVFTLNNRVAFSIWALVGDGIAGYFRSPTSARFLNLVFGSLPAGVAM